MWDVVIIVTHFRVAKPELPNCKSFLGLPGVLNENPTDININDIIYCVLKHKCLKLIKEMSLFDQSMAKLNN